MIITKDLMETPTATRFNLISKEDFSFRHANCLHLKNIQTNEQMKLIWRKKTLEIIPNDVRMNIFIDLSNNYRSFRNLGITYW